MREQISWWTYTTRYTPFDKNGISSPIMVNVNTGEECPSNKLPIGACWNCNEAADGKENKRRYLYPLGADGLSIACRLPNGEDWHIDSRANNCPDRSDSAHRCWVRHGTFGSMDLHVDKNGLTCSAGAGSISVPNFHGFLRHGYLEDC